ncbi:sensor histidine kinase [Ornithinimicrobium pekingense]|uniref:histidine kinase n=1 Tax=Ornithinimicrobium pekingense TaxID=384677 RepID=A0ABQ2FC79_9MICO|nr:histidine kinase [Ornithinimicrobium pekingense]GGK71567.1 hypothetical protein GCM10011509_20080 [Ornithinimicrobium pekingense]
MHRQGARLAAGTVLLLLVTLAAADDLLGIGSLTSGPALATVLAWLVCAAAVAVAVRCAGSGGSTAAWMLLLLAAAAWAPALSGRSWVPAVLDGPLLAAAALVPLLLALHGTAWAGRPGPRALVVVAGLPALAAAVTVLAYSPLGDPLCTTGCGSAGAPWADPAHAREVTVLVALLTGASAAAGLVLVWRRRRHTPGWVVRGVVAGLLVVPVLGWLRATAWGLTAGPPDRPVWSLLPVALATAGTGAYLWTLASVRRRLRAVVTRLGDVTADPSLGQVHFALPEEGRWIDLHGSAAQEGPDPGQALVVTDDAGRPWARLSMPGGQPVDDLACDASVWLLLENARQTAMLRADQRAVESSRRQVVARSDGERRRIEHDLHDGVQQRLVSAKLHLAIARSAAPAEVSGDLLEVDDRLQHALTSLRDVSHGLFPRSLEAEGLTPALQELAGTRPMTLHLAGPVDDVPLPVRTTVYAVAHRLVGEAVGEGHPVPELTVRRSGGTVTVDARLAGLARTDVAEALLEVEDRVGALGGRVRAAASHGVLHVRAELPCGS